MNQYFEDLMSLNEVDNHENPLIKLHFVNPLGWEWHIVAGDKSPLDNDEDYLFFGVGNITCQEMGIFSLKEIQSYGAVIDTEWTPIPLYTFLK